MSNTQATDNSNLIASALLKTDPALWRAVDGGNSWRASIEKRGARVAQYRSYERGDHDAELTAQMRQMLRLNTSTAELNDFNINYCRIIVDKMSSRLHVAEITAKDETVDEWITQTLARNRYESGEGEIFRGAIRDADSYVTIDSETALWASEPAYDGFSGMFVIFDDLLNVPIWACKLWSVADSDDIAEDKSTNIANMRLLVYQPNHISWWSGQAGSADVSPGRIPKSEAESEAGENFIDWPLGILPVVHFVNAKDNYSSYGASELRVAISPQNALNRTLHSMIMASEFSAFRLLWSKGMILDLDGITPGAAINLVLGTATTESAELTELQIEFLKAVEVGEFEPTDMTQYVSQLDKLVREISQVTQTPIYGITAQGNLSGEALRQLEVGLIGKVHRFQRENSDAIKQLLRITAEIEQEFNVNGTIFNAISDVFRRVFRITIPGSVPDLSNATLSVNWKSPEIVDTSVQILALSELRRNNPGLWTDEWYRERVGALFGMTQKQIADEGERAKNELSINFEFLTGGGGVPPVV